MKDSQVILVRRANEPSKGLWDIPGGFCDAGEHPMQTAQRELLEETGIEIQIVGFLGMWVDEYGCGDPRKHTLNIYYHAIPLGEPPDAFTSKEVSELALFSASELPSDLAFVHVTAALEAWKSALLANQIETMLFDRVIG
jgi:ADP-ribose pyrophosphatase YjhB (NUDIX family)